MSEESSAIKISPDWVGKRIRINTRPDPKGVVSFYSGNVVSAENGILVILTVKKETAIILEGNIGMVVFDPVSRED